MDFNIFFTFQDYKYVCVCLQIFSHYKLDCFRDCVSLSSTNYLSLGNLSVLHKIYFYFMGTVC